MLAGTPTLINRPVTVNESVKPVKVTARSAQELHPSLKREVCADDRDTRKTGRKSHMHRKKGNTCTLPIARTLQCRHQRLVNNHQFCAASGRLKKKKKSSRWIQSQNQKHRCASLPAALHHFDPAACSLTHMHKCGVCVHGARSTV